ncbi:MAG: M6 family metalloprotease domain-containing protein [Candidatus Cryptobacteroides sp.]
MTKTEITTERMTSTRYFALMLVSAALAFLCQTALAKKAIPCSITLTQPDGSTLEATLKGDEFSHYVTDLQGHVLKQNSDGFWCYGLFSPDGSLHSSGFIAGGDAPGHIISASSYVPHQALSMNSVMKRTSVRQGRALTKAGDEGPVKKHCIILLGQYQDVKMTYAQEDFSNLINSGPTSARQYFEDQFLGSYDFTFEIGPIVTLANKQEYYGKNDSSGNDAKAAEAVAEACRLASAQGVDFSLYDDDGDGEVDNVFVFMAGKDEAEGGGENCIWSHSWYLSAANINLVIDGKRIDSYAISSELSYISDSRKYLFTTIGTFCHEYSHTLGLMDMYDTDAETGGTSDCLWGTTALMDSGNYNDSGRTPPYYNAIDRDMLGIGNPEELKPGTYELEPVNLNGRYFRYETGNEGEYYLIECRGNSGWDKYIGGSGLAIYHIDKSQNMTGMSEVFGRTVKASERWWSNEVNCLSTHQCADMMEAYPDAVSAAQVFFPYNRNDSFSSFSTPAFKFWDGTASPIALSGISRNGDNMVFTVGTLGSVLPGPATVTNQEIFQDGAVIQWEISDPSYSGEAVVEWGRSGKEMEKVSIKPYSPGKYALALFGLDGSTAYNVRIWYEADGVKGKEAAVNFTTRTVYKDSYPYMYLRNVARNGDGSFPEGALLPLRIYNLAGKGSIEWFMDGKSVNVDGSGYYEVRRSGGLKAVITYDDGSTDVVYKMITVR